MGKFSVVDAFLFLLRWHHLDPKYISQASGVLCFFSHLHASSKNVTSWEKILFTDII